MEHAVRIHVTNGHVHCFEYWANETKWLPEDSSLAFLPNSSNALWASNKITTEKVSAYTAFTHSYTAKSWMLVEV